MLTGAVTRQPFWPKPARQAGRTVLLGCAAAGLTAAIALRPDRPGLGFLLTALACAAAVLIAAKRLRPAGSRSVPRALWAAAALALTAVGVLRAADWLCWLCLLAALVAGSLAVAGERGERSVRGLLFGAFAVPLAALPAWPWLWRGVRARRGTGRLVVSALVGLGLLAVFGSLLAGADAAFAELLRGVLPAVDGGTSFRQLVLFGLVGCGTAGACYLLVARPTLTDPPVGQRSSVRRLEWAVPVGLLVLLFAAFVAVQLTVLFGGSSYVLRTANLTYAQYARGGFWQLLAVTVLTLAVLAAAVRLAPRSTSADRAWLRGLLGALAGLTLVVVLSALSRMWSYQQAYGFTVLRLVVEACELWLGVVYLLVIAAGVRLRTSWLPGAVTAAAVAALLVLAVLDPERFIAERNVARWQQTGAIDLRYLGELSTDAVSALDRLPEPARNCVLTAIAERLGSAGDDDWRSWNNSRSAAQDTLAKARVSC
ncbi:DUF4153 domain-containing protein [Solihabitans fulvus]|uniref:DUF4153 domain-containing protein n=1 Tax=Solihabitans fulvus TaxID=1892852 RepID=UPI001CB75F81|nr:DUF4173 domain-containing protein [Solihabitans fulvus]